MPYIESGSSFGAQLWGTGFLALVFSLSVSDKFLSLPAFSLPGVHSGDHGTALTTLKGSFWGAEDQPQFLYL